MADKELTDLLNEVAEEAEAAEATVDPDAPLPAHVTVSRPNRARTRVLQVRFNPDEFEALEAIAARQELPVSTIARDYLLQLVTRDRCAVPPRPEWSAGDLVDHLEVTLAQLRHALLASDTSILRWDQSESNA